jgi:hypothetical protein
MQEAQMFMHPLVGVFSVPLGEIALPALTGLVVWPLIVGLVICALVLYHERALTPIAHGSH